jgi:hypothetical protein
MIREFTGIQIGPRQFELPPALLEPFGPRAIEAAVSIYDAERIVCGTDGTEFGCDWTRKALAEAQTGEEAREQILYGNAAAMLARVARAAQD